MNSDLYKLTRILRFLMFLVKPRHFTAYKQRHKSTRKFHLLAVFFLSVFFSCILCDTAKAEKTLDISKVQINGTILKETSEGVYSGTITSSSSLSIAIFSSFESLTEYNLKATISFSYPQTVASYLNVTPYYSDLKDGYTYLAEIGKISSSTGSELKYHTKIIL